MNNFKIFIPSYKRADRLLSKPNTLDYIPEDLKGNTVIVIRKEETRDYMRVLEKYSNRKGKQREEIMKFLSFSDIHNVKETRDAIIDYAIEQKLEYIIVIDDDLKLAHRPFFDYKTDLPNKYEEMTKQQFYKMVRELLYYCNEVVPLTGITGRQFSNTKLDYYSENTRIIQLFCMYIPVIASEGLRYGNFDGEFMSDYFFTLSLLTKGYKNICFNHSTRDDNMQTEGGCQTYRTAELLSDSAKKLYKCFPDIVTLKWKNNGAFNEKHIGVSVRWKKAFNEKEFENREKQFMDGINI
jgi:hypothetical protein